MNTDAQADMIDEAITDWCGEADIKEFADRKAAYWAWRNKRKEARNGNK